MGAKVKHTNSNTKTLTTTKDIVQDGELVVRNLGGRPSKITNELIQDAWDYLHSISVNDSGRVPTIEGLSLSIGINRDTIYDWEKKDVDKRFSDIVKQLRAVQAEKLLQNSLTGKYNPMIAKLMLSKHGYVEKTEQDNTVTVVQPIVGGMAKAEIADEPTDT